MSSTRLPLLCAASLAWSTLASREARAEDVSSLLEILEENVVSGASRSAERESDAPAMSSVITGAQLKLFGISRLADALTFLASGFFAHDRMSVPEVGARGVALTRDSNSHVLIVLDGMVVNEQGGGAVFLHDIPIEIVDHIEVVLGPGSVLYGAQAMLGVINVVTKKAADLQGLRASLMLGASPPLDESGNIKAPALDGVGGERSAALGFGRRFTLLGQPAGVVASVDLQRFEGPDVSFPKQRLPAGPGGAPAMDLGSHAEPGMWGGPVKEQWFRSKTGAYVRFEAGDLSASAQATRSTWAVPFMDLHENRVGAYDDARNDNTQSLILTSVRYRARLSERLEGVARGYFGYSRIERSRHVVGHDPLVPHVPLNVLDPEQCPRGPDGPCRKEALFLSRWVGLELQARYDWAGYGAFSTMAGVDGRLRTSAYELVAFDELTGKSYGSNPERTRWHGGGHRLEDEAALGAYVQQTLRPVRPLSLNAGIRVDLDSRIPLEYVPNAISPRAALIVTPDERVSLKLIYSSAFRAPSFVELYTLAGRLLPNPNGLKPENVSSVEAVSSFRTGAYSFTAGGFYSDWQDVIELQIVKAQAPSVSSYNNVPGIENYGANLGFEASFLERKLRVGANSTFAMTRRRMSEQQIARNARFGTGDDVPITVAPQVYGNARVSYEIGSGAVSLAAAYMGRRIADQAYYGGDPSNIAPRPEVPPQLELRAALTGAIPWVKGAEYTLGGQYAFSAHEPYVVGPNQGQPRYLVEHGPTADFALKNRLTLFAGIELHLDDDDAAGSPAAAADPSASASATAGRARPGAPL
ncbi:TonB-dependent receptor plug domain-containing protein [Sorangium sp. So ce1000]|uniref:TonB-dependent receptor plug domain-containing protein n=1 Tax=Sorangium sp. So ce1000 TaxID=3133325 RepID=UPI003F5F78D9